jgi:hypothetical protein
VAGFRSARPGSACKAECFVLSTRESFPIDILGTSDQVRRRGTSRPISETQSRSTELSEAASAATRKRAVRPAQFIFA